MFLAERRRKMSGRRRRRKKAGQEGETCNFFNT
jgi:hypothetical protein